MMMRSAVFIYSVLTLIGVVISDNNNNMLAVRFVEHPQSVIALPGDSVFFNCRANVADATITWTLNTTPLDASIDERVKINEGELVVEVSRDARDRRSQLGAYQCLASINNTRIVSLPAELEIAHIEDFRGDRNHSIEVFEMNDVVIACDPPPSLPEAIVQFYKDGQLLHLDYYSEEDSVDRRRMLNTNLLLIKNVTSDLDSGIYSCSATNHMTNEVKVSLSSTYLVVNAPSDKHNGARLTFWPLEEYRVAENQDLIVPCVASGHPLPNVIWSRMEGANEIISQNEGLLVINNAQQSHEGDYMCAVSNGGRRFLRRTTLKLLEEPNFAKDLISVQLNQGDNEIIDCDVRGQPSPETKWFFNGQVVDEHQVLLNNSLLVEDADKRDVGVYQCIAVNEVGKSLLNVIVNVDNNGDYNNNNDEPRMMAPSRPILRQLGPDSVLLTWNQPTSSMAVQFFKVQFREIWPSNGFNAKRRSEWRTMDEVISARSRSFEVLGLKERVRYRFRIVAVFVNNDNLHSPLSKRFRLDTKTFNKKQPNTAPIITQVLPLGPRALRVGWRMDLGGKSDVEGYFILIRPFINGHNNKRNHHHNRKWRKVTIMGATSHSYIFDDLEPDTGYEVRVQAFNFAGNSPHSKSFRQSTLGTPAPSSSSNTSNPNKTLSNSSLTSSTSLSPNTSLSNSSRLSDDEMALSLILGGGIAGALLVLILYCTLINCLQRRRAQKALESDNNIHEKYSDTSRNIQRSHVSSHVSVFNHDMESVGCEASSMSLLNAVNSGVVSSNSSNTTAETSFSANVRSQDQARLEEYETEPNRNTWKRRRKSEILV